MKVALFASPRSADGNYCNCCVSAHMEIHQANPPVVLTIDLGRPGVWVKKATTFSCLLDGL